MRALLFSVSKSIGLTAAIIISAAFASTAGARPLDPIPDEEIQARINELQQIPWDGKSIEKDVTTTLSGCVKSTLQLNVFDPETGAARQMTLQMRRPDVLSKVPLVVVIPTIEGTTPLEPEAASNLCGNYIATIIAEVADNTQPQELPSWGLEDRRNRQSITAIRTILDYAEKDARFDRNKLGLMGLSQGGITASMLAAIERDRLKAIVVGAGGGNLPFILAASDSSQVSTLRERRMDHLGMTQATEYEDRLRESVRYDPIYFAPRVNRDRVLMVMAEQDTKVPYLIQQEAFEAFGKPDFLLFSGGHVMTLISLVYWHMDSVVEFLNSRFGLPDGWVPTRRIQQRIILQ